MCDPPIDNVDPKTEADECLKIALDKMASASAGHPPTLPHIRNVAGHALERINELEAEIDQMRIKYDGRMAELRQVTQDAHNLADELAGEQEDAAEREFNAKESGFEAGKRGGWM